MIAPQPPNADAVSATPSVSTGGATAPSRLHLAFCMRHSGYLRLYESFLRELAARGHTVHLVIRQFDALYDERVLGALEEELVPHLTWEVLDETRLEPGRLLLRLLRCMQDYLRYLAPAYRTAHSLRARAATRLPRVARAVCNVVGRSQALSWGLIRLLRGVDQCVGAPTSLVEWLDARQPDALIITPLVDFGATQLPWMKAARVASTPTILAVASWDNLTNKGLVQLEPDGVLLWNRFQEKEARTFHRLTRTRIATTGAQVFDPWFAMKPSTTETEFRQRVGLEPDRNHLLYLCSSPFIAPDEVSFVKRWLDALRNSDALGAKTVGVLIRPHPQNATQWDAFDETEYPNVAVHPRGGATPIHTSTRNDFFDSMAHAQAVIGINTSAMIEAGILDKPVFTIQDDDFVATQEGTLHYHYLVDGGLLTVANDLPEHLDQLRGTLIGADPQAEARRSFVAEFIRPHGWETPAAEVLTDSVESMTAELRAHPRTPSIGERVAALPSGASKALARHPRAALLLTALALPFLTLGRWIASWGNSRRVLHLLRCGHQRDAAAIPDPLLFGDLVRAPGRKVSVLLNGSIAARCLGVALTPLLLVAFFLVIVYGAAVAIIDLPFMLGYPLFLLCTRYRSQPRTLIRLLIVGPTKARTSASKLDAIRDPIQLLDAMDQRCYGTAPISAVLNKLRASDRPVVIGPWMGEVGFEVLYWIPFVSWLLRAAKVDSDRVHIASRGGTAEWYQAIGGRYEDLLGHHTVEEFRAFQDRRVREIGHQKQSKITGADRSALAPVLDAWDVQQYELVHPSIMYGVFRHFWFGEMPLRAIGLLCDFKRLEHHRPEWSVVSDLPEQYVAMKFYFSESFPDTSETRAFVRDVLETVARHNKVVLLNTQLELDEHKELSDGIPESVLVLSKEMLPHNNLEVQTQVIAGASAFIGTYGGFSYLAPFYGVPSFAFHANEDGFVPEHVDTAHLAFRTANEHAALAANFTMFSTQQWKILASFFGSAAAASKEEWRRLPNDVSAPKP